MNKVSVYTFRDFILDQMKIRGMSARQFADFVGVAHTTISRSIDARNPVSPGLEFLIKLSKATQANLPSLVAMAYPDATQETALSPSAQIIAQEFEKLPADLQELVLSIIRGRAG